MLTNTRISRGRLVAGATSVLGLVTAGLVVTASGTRAAAAVSERIEAATGVALQAAPPAPPQPPAPPAAPAIATDARPVIVTRVRTRAAAPGEPVPPVPPVPPAALVPGSAPATVTAADGRIHRVFVTRPGETFTMVMPQAVTSRSCQDGPDGGPKQFVLHRADGDTPLTIICTNRVQAAAAKGAAEGAAMAANGAATEANAIAQAREGLRNARAGIATNRDMTDGQRAAALAGIAQAETELAESGRH